MEKWLEAKTIATWIIIVFVVVVILTVSIVKLVYLNIQRQVEHQLKESKLQLAYQRKLIETSILVQERERDRIAADLHDALIGKLTTLRLQNQLRHKIEEIDAGLEDSIADARRISHDLSPPMLEFIDLQDIVGNLVNAWSVRLNIVYEKRISSRRESSAASKLQISRMLQELMTNMYKHAEATEVRISLRVSDKCTILLVADNGKGFDVKKAAEGLGLKNIELRVLYLNGKFKTKSGSKGTTSVFVFNV